jgi:hypothetical protein
MRGWIVAACAVCLAVAGLAAQTVIDRVVARVNGNPITLTDLRAAVGLGLIQAPAGADLQPALQQIIDRRLQLDEVERFPPPEPTSEAVDAELAALRARAGAALPALMESTGLDEARLREAARQNVRLRAYLDQRFGTTVQVSDEEVDQYYRAHPDEFLRDGLLIPFDEAEAVARERAGTLRRQATIAQWVSDLRNRGNVALPGS